MRSRLLETAARIATRTRSQTQLESCSVAGNRGLIPPSRARVSSDPRSLDAVYRALFVLETAARQLTVDVWRGEEKLAEIPSIIRRPALDMSRSAFIAETVNSLAQRGNAYWHVHRRGYEVLTVDILNPLEVAAWRDLKTGRIRYSWQGREFPAADMIHLKLTHQPGEIYGLSPIQACAATIQGAIDMRKYADNWTMASGRPTGVLTTDQQLTSQQAEQWKAAANETLTPGSGIGVFGNGLQYRPLLLNPQELQFLENQQANVTTVARMFGIPARLMLASVDGGSDTYSNMQQEDISFLRYTLMGYLREIEEGLTELVSSTMTVRFNLEGLLRTDTKTRYEAHQIGLASGFLTVNEIRDIEGLPTTATKTPDPTEAH